MDVKSNGRSSGAAIFRGVWTPPFLVLYAIGLLGVSRPCLAQVAPNDRWLASDKALHAFAAGWIAGASYAAGIELDWAPAERRQAGVTAAVTASLAKEALDAWTEGKRFSFKDLTADAVGIAAFVALSAAADR